MGWNLSIRAYGRQNATEQLSNHPDCPPIATKFAVDNLPYLADGHGAIVINIVATDNAGDTGGKPTKMTYNMDFEKLGE